jgi:ribonucleotide reductase alpha subunit
MEHHGLTIDPNRDKLIDEYGIRRLRESYMMETEISPQERFAFVSRQFASDSEHAQRLYDYSSKHWLSYSTPILSFGRSSKGLPISCFGDGTLVRTENGFKKIEDICVGDKVLTHTGEYQEVEETRASTSNDIYELTFANEVFLVTGNHLIMTKEHGWMRVDELDPTMHEIAHIQD